MIDAVMHQLVYKDPPTYTQYESYREYLRRVSQFACTYCTITESESPGATFNIDHFRPETLFHSLEASCSNLRYTCPRCNSYKRHRWITIEEGCIRDCDKCTNQICRKNTDRFIDVIEEDPSAIIYLGQDNKLYAFSGSKPADYTIKYLRLNREQLVKLRYVRKFMDSWQSDLARKKEEATQKLDSIREEQQEFLAKNISTSNSKEQSYLNVISTMYDMLVVTAEQSLLQIEEEIERLNKLMKYRIGSDSVIE